MRALAAVLYLLIALAPAWAQAQGARPASAPATRSAPDASPSPEPSATNPAYETVVTGKRPLARDRTQGATLVEGRRLRESARPSTFEALAQEAADVYVPGRGVGPHGVASGATGGIRIRGLGGSPNSQVLIVEDGVPDYQGIFGHPHPRRLRSLPHRSGAWSSREETRSSTAPTPSAARWSFAVAGGSSRATRFRAIARSAATRPCASPPRSSRVRVHGTWRPPFTASRRMDTGRGQVGATSSVMRRFAIDGDGCSSRRATRSSTSPAPILGLLRTPHPTTGSMSGVTARRCSSPTGAARCA